MSAVTKSGTSGAEEALRQLVKEVIRSWPTSLEPLRTFARRFALYNTAFDAAVSDCPSYPAASSTMAGLPSLKERYGEDSAARLTLQFVYAYLEKMGHAEYDEGAFLRTWEDFLEELRDPEWHLVVVANLTNFNSDSDVIELADGVTIRHRVVDRLRCELGWSDLEIQQLQDDWSSGQAASSYVMYVDESVPKDPSNLVLGSTGTAPAKIERSLAALRLYADGDVNVGGLFHARRAKFNVGLGGLGRAPSTAPQFAFGSRYRLRAGDVPAVQKLYELLRAFDADPPSERHLALAFRRFSLSYTRDIRGHEDQLVDLITALEALLGTDDELAFRLSFRVSNLLAATEDQRVELSRTMKDYYATRSRIVHGGELKQKQLDLVNSQRGLREIVRRLLVAVLVAHSRQESPFLRKYVREELDDVLLHAERRESLRAAIGLRDGLSLGAIPAEDEGGYIAAFDRVAGPPSAEVYIGDSAEPAEFN